MERSFVIQNAFSFHAPTAIDGQFQFELSAMIDARLAPPVRVWMSVLAVFLISLSVPMHTPATAATPTNQKTTEVVTIRVIEGGWGNSDVRDIHRVLDSVVAVLLPQSQHQRRIAVRVVHRFGNPMVAYERGAEGEYIVYLTARNDRWYQFAYEFSHEFCHILSNFDRKGRGGEIVRDSQWFEEAICETASLFTLRQLATTWDAAPPDARWAGYGHHFQEYLDRFLAEPHRQPSHDQTLAEWFRNNAEGLHDKPYQRAKNELVAKALLPLFERNPGNWAALDFINADYPTGDKKFRDYLLAWQEACPQDLRSFVGEIIEMFGLSAVPLPVDR